MLLSRSLLRTRKDERAHAPAELSDVGCLSSISATQGQHASENYLATGIPPRLLALRSRETIRNLLSREVLTAADVVMPILVTAPVFRESRSILPTYTVEDVGHEVRQLWEVGVRGAKVFAMARGKDWCGSESTDPHNLMLDAIRAIKDAVPSMCVITEACLCAYTTAGSCTLLNRNGEVDFPGTCHVLQEIAVLQAEAGADVVGPAGMLDGGVRAVREALDAAGFCDVGLMPHLIVDSSLYRLYRTTMRADPLDGGERRLQIDSSRPQQAELQARRFLEEGADMLLLEPALPVVDVLRNIRAMVGHPIGVFSVSGEYELFARDGLVSIHNPALLEFLCCLKRSGADFIVTYAAKDVARWLQGGAKGMGA